MTVQFSQNKSKRTVQNNEMKFRNKSFAFIA